MAEFPPMTFSTTLMAQSVTITKLDSNGNPTGKPHTVHLKIDPDFLPELEEFPQ